MPKVQPFDFSSYYWQYNKKRIQKCLFFRHFSGNKGNALIYRRKKCSDFRQL